jgi:hypothetical protein
MRGVPVSSISGLARQERDYRRPVASQRYRERLNWVDPSVQAQVVLVNAFLEMEDSLVRRRDPEICPNFWLASSPCVCAGLTWPVSAAQLS